MGFRCFESLNIAMLMKQLWRVLTYPELLLSKIYKAKYIRDQNISDIKPKPTDSSAWKSLCSVMGIMHSGLSEGDAIIPYKWKYSTHGIYTVRSGYNHALRWKLAQIPSSGETSNMESITKGWARLWKLRLPDRLKIFAWRLYYDALPTFRNMFRRGCDTELKCQQCGFMFESTNHILFECWWSKCVWKALEVHWPENKESSPADWLWHFITNRRPEELTLIIVGAWLIWKNRNSVVHGNEGWTVKQCQLKASTLIEQFSSKCLLSISPFYMYDLRSPRDFVIWCDGSWSHINAKGGFAAVSSQDGVIQNCYAGVIASCSSSIEAELRGIYAGLNMAMTIALPEVTICL